MRPPPALDMIWDYSSVLAESRSKASIFNNYVVEPRRCVGDQIGTRYGFVRGRSSPSKLGEWSAPRFDRTRALARRA